MGGLCKIVLISLLLVPAVCLGAGEQGLRVSNAFAMAHGGLSGLPAQRTTTNLIASAPSKASLKPHIEVNAAPAPKITEGGPNEGLTASAQQQARVTVVTTEMGCDKQDRMVGARRVWFNQVEVLTDAQGEAVTSLPFGTYTVKVDPSYQLTSISQQYHRSLGSGSYSSFGIGPDSQGIFTVEITTISDILGIDMDSCARAQTVNVKIIATQSCSAETDKTLEKAPFATVRIGDQTVTTGTDGTAEIYLRAGKYRVDASLSDTTFAYVNQRGRKIFYSTEGTPGHWVTLSQSSEALEFRLLNCDASGLRKARARVDEVSELRGQGITVRRTNVSGRAFVGMLLRDGDEVSVVGKAKIAWLEGNGIIFVPGDKVVEFVIEENLRRAVRFPPDPNEGGRKVGVIQGFINFWWPKGDAKTTKFGVSTGTVITSIKGTKFQVGYDAQNQISKISVEEGDVLVTPTNPGLQELTLHGGQQVQVGRANVGPLLTFTEHLDFGSNGAGPQPPAQTSDLTGLWIDNSGGAGVYRLRQIGKRVYWASDGTSQGRYANVFIGDISGNIINGTWVDLPGSPALGGGNMTLRIESNSTLVKVSESSCCYGAQSWTRKGR